jgi:hypothetical protein
MSSILTITGIGISPYAARGLTETISPIPSTNQLVRTVNGTLIDLSLPAFRKYAVLITGSDQRPPCFNGIWPGVSVTVACISLLARTGGSADRTPVTGSIFTEEAITYYRPQLTMRVTDFQWTTDEFGARVGWTLALEEV